LILFETNNNPIDMPNLSRDAVLKALEISEGEYHRLLRWSVLPSSGFSLAEVEWVEECLELTFPTATKDFLLSCVERGVIDLLPTDEQETDPDVFRPTLYQIEIPWHRLNDERSKTLFRAALHSFAGATLEKLRQITSDFCCKDFYLSSCREYDNLSKLIFYVLKMVVCNNRPFSMEEEFWRSIFYKSFFGQVNEACVIGTFWYLQDRMEDGDRDMFLTIRDSMLPRAHWTAHPVLFSLIIKMERVRRIVKISKKFGDTSERKPMIEDMEADLKMARRAYDLHKDYPCTLGFYNSVLLDIMEKAPMMDNVRRDAAWKSEIRILCGKTLEYWEQARQQLKGTEDECHAVIHHIHALSKDAHLQMLACEMTRSDELHQQVLAEAERIYGDHKITATFASFYGDFYIKRLLTRLTSTKEEDYRKAMQFFMKEYRILQHCDKRDQSRTKINLAKQGYVKALLGQGKEALVDAKKAYLMGEEKRDGKSEGSGYLRYNFLNVIFLHWMGLEDKHSMGSKWWMNRELRTLLSTNQRLGPLRQSGALLIPKGSSVKPTSHEELIHNLVVSVYRVQARPRLLAPRIHPGKHQFWNDVLDNYITSEEDQLIALEAVNVYVETGGNIFYRPGEAAIGLSKAAMERLSLSDDKENKSADDSGLGVSFVDREDAEPEVVLPRVREPEKLLEAVDSLVEARIIDKHVLAKWRRIRKV